ncbi:MAG: hypothetical protein FVQ80_06015 [Planctomycetes bacterium]|nr:hypothetical protein [Planctomycetota bacterium]
MDYAKIRKLSLKIFLGFLGLTALIAIISLLSGAEFGELQWKILGTCLMVSATSICSMSCAAFIEKKGFVWVGFLGILFSVVSAILVISGMWLEIDSEVGWKVTISFIIAALAFAHGFLLVLPELNAKQKWVQRVSSVSIGILAVQIGVAVWTEFDHGVYYRILAVVAIIVGLLTLAIPILMKLRKGAGQKKPKLVLEKVEGDVYSDSSGKQYQLKEINCEQEKLIR